MKATEQIEKLAKECNIGFASASALVYGYVSHLNGNKHAKSLVEDELITIVRYLSREVVEDFWAKVEKAKPSAWVLAKALHNQRK